MASLGSNYSNDLLHGNANGAELAHNQSLATIDSHTSHHSAVSWAAVLAGTAAAAALSLILIILGFGLGMSSLSLWSGQGMSTAALGITTIVWLAFTQIIAYGMGGYLAGRLRTKWVSLHSDEVYFRDTAHGFLTWALASLLCATMFTSVISSIIGSSAKVGATLIGGTTSALITGAASNIDTNNTSIPSANNSMNYMVGTLFRKDAASLSTSTNESSVENSADVRFMQKSNQVSEVMSIFMNSMGASTLPLNDVKYVAQLVSQQTGLPQQDAEKRVEMTFASMQEKKASAMTIAKNTADKARKVAANTSLWFFVFLLVGAFSASLAATWGGECRDN